MEEFIDLSNVPNATKLESGEVRVSYMTGYHGYTYRLDTIHEHYVIVSMISNGANISCKNKTIPNIKIPIKNWEQFDIIPPKIDSGLIKKSEGIMPEASQLLKRLISRLDTHSPNRSED